MDWKTSQLPKNGEVRRYKFFALFPTEGTNGNTYWLCFLQKVEMFEHRGSVHKFKYSKWLTISILPWEKSDG